MDLTENYDDVFDEGMHRSEDLRATFNCHTNHDDEDENEPRQEAND